mgnify:CR=1 FL=1
MSRHYRWRIFSSYLSWLWFCSWLLSTLSHLCQLRHPMEQLKFRLRNTGPPPLEISLKEFGRKALYGYQLLGTRTCRFTSQRMGQERHAGCCDFQSCEFEGHPNMELLVLEPWLCTQVFGRTEPSSSEHRRSRYYLLEGQLACAHPWSSQT